MLAELDRCCPQGQVVPPLTCEDAKACGGEAHTTQPEPELKVGSRLLLRS
jgi:hypothetical protein